MFRSISLMVLFLALTCNASSQAQKKPGAPNLRLTLSMEKTIWLVYEPVPVKITVENLSGNKVQLPSSIYFKFDNRESESVRVTMSEGVFWSPVSLTKTYSKEVKGCEDDLIAERVEVLQDTNIVLISPPKDNLMLQKDEKKEFRFDLSKTCWNHSLSSIYPNGYLFSYVGASRKYKVYFEMEFKVGSAKLAGSDTPINLNKRLKSNEVEIVFDR